ncbi:protein of unknown function [Agreia sp. COWG]|nr:protein of unknown function [Agreia sp. COWG]
MLLEMRVTAMPDMRLSNRSFIVRYGI